MRREFAIFTLILTSQLWADPELKGTPDELKNFLEPPARIVTIEGHASEKAYADTAHISLVVTTEDKQLSQALDLNAKLRRQLVASFVSNGIDASHINSSKFSTSPQYGWFGAKPSSYEVINRMKISVNSEAHMKLLAAAADQHKQVSFGDTEFEYSGKRVLQQKVKAMALDDAEQQKQQLESVLALKLRAVGIINPRVFARPTRAARAVIEEVVVSARQQGAAKLYQDQAAPQKTPSFDEMEFEASVSVIYEVVL